MRPQPANKKFIFFDNAKLFELLGLQPRQRLKTLSAVVLGKDFSNLRNRWQGCSNFSEG